MPTCKSRDLVASSSPLYPFTPLYLSSHQTYAYLLWILSRYYIGTPFTLAPFVMDRLFYQVPFPFPFLSPFEFTASYLVPLLITFLFLWPYLATQLLHQSYHHMLTLSPFYLSTFRLIPIGSTLIYLSWPLLIYRLIGSITLPPQFWVFLLFLLVDSYILPLRRIG
jgi:hypothetical protein